MKKKEKRRVLANMQAMILHRESKGEVFKPVKVKVKLTEIERTNIENNETPGKSAPKTKEVSLVLPNGYEAEKYIKKLQNVDKPAEYAIWIRWKTLSVTPKIQLTIEEVFE